MRWKQNDSSPAGGNRRRRLIAAAGLTAFVLAMAAICLMAGKPMLALLSDPDRFRDWVDERGLWGRAAFVGMMSLQIIAAMIPGEPLEIAAGYAFGAAEGTALCLLGALLGGDGGLSGGPPLWPPGGRGVFFHRRKSTPCRSCETDAGWRDGCSLCFCSPEPPRTCLPTVRG